MTLGDSFQTMSLLSMQSSEFSAQNPTGPSKAQQPTLERSIEQCSDDPQALRGDQAFVFSAGLQSRLGVAGADWEGKEGVPSTASDSRASQ